MKTYYQFQQSNYGDCTYDEVREMDEMNICKMSHMPDSKERIALDLMIKIIHCHAHHPLSAETGVKDENVETSNCPSHDKDYLLNLYSECLRVVKQQKKQN